MIENELQPEFYHGLTRQEVIDNIIEFEIANEISPELWDILEFGFTGYHYVDDETLKELYLDYFTDEEYEEDPDVLPPDYLPMDGHGDHIPNDYKGGAQ